MVSDEARPTKVSRFIMKLYIKLEKPGEKFLKWSDCGTHFIVLDKNRFAVEELHEICHHNNLASFVRMLNLYGFVKMQQLGTSQDMVYRHEHFKKAHPEELPKIQRNYEGDQEKITALCKKRKITDSEAPSESLLATESDATASERKHLRAEIQELRDEVRTMKDIVFRTLTEMNRKIETLNRSGSNIPSSPSQMQQPITYPGASSSIISPLLTTASKVY